MSRLLTTLASCAVLLALFSGCASVPKVEMSRDSAARLKKIALLDVTEPHDVQVADLGGAAGAFGLVGGLIQAASNADNAKKFTAAIKEQKVSFSNALLGALERALKADGFEVVRLPNQKPKLAGDGKSDDFSDVRGEADAFLASGFGAFGYVSQPNSTRYEPWVVIKVRLVDATSKQDLYFKSFMLGWKMKIENAVSLSVDQEFRYNSFDDLMARAPHAIAGLVRSCEIVSLQVGEDLRPR